jgi:hypothetical protein
MLRRMHLKMCSQHLRSERPMTRHTITAAAGYVAAAAAARSHNGMNIGAKKASAVAANENDDADTGICAVKRRTREGGRRRQQLQHAALQTITVTWRTHGTATAMMMMMMMMMMMRRGACGREDGTRR